MNWYAKHFTKVIGLIFIQDERKFLIRLKVLSTLKNNNIKPKKNFFFFNPDICINPYPLSL